MQINPYLTFNGSCEEAFNFYARSLGGDIVAMHTHGNSPMKDHVPVDWHPKIMHAQLTVRGQTLMGSDVPPGRYEASKGISVSVNVEDAATAERVFHALSEGGAVQMPIQETFWAVRFGMLVDRFGVPWMINCMKTA